MTQIIDSTIKDPIQGSTSTGKIKLSKKSELNLVSVEQLIPYLTIPKLIKKAEFQALLFQKSFSMTPTLPPLISPVKQINKIPLDAFNKISGVYGYKSPNASTQCGPASMATVIDFSGIYWPDISRLSNGHFDNDTFVGRVMEWSGTPDTPGGWIGTTPMRIQEKLNGLCGRRSAWYAGGTPENTWWNIKNEIDAGRPVIVLVDFGQIGHSFILDWQVVFGYDDTGVYCKVTSGIDVDYFWDYASFYKVMNNNLPLIPGMPSWSQTFITFIK